MLFVDMDGNGVEVDSIRRAARKHRDPEAQRLLRDRVLLLLRRAGLTDQDLAEIGGAFADEPIRDRSAIYRRLADAEALATREAQQIGLLETE